MSFLDQYTLQEIKAYIADSSCFTEVLSKMGRSTNSGSNRMLISLYAQTHNIDITHFHSDTQIRTPENVFVQNSTATQAVLRRYYKKGNYSEYQCAICGQQPFWNGQELVLTLDHINGINNDHRLENLRWVCPNCDRQLPTYGAKRTKKHAYCNVCGVEISPRNKSCLCKKCLTEQRNEKKKAKAKRSERKIHSSRRVQRPNVMEFAKMVKEFGFQEVGRRFGLSGKAVQKWCYSYQIPHTKKELVDWYDQQMGIEIPKTIHKRSISELVRPVKQIDISTGNTIAVFSNQAEATRTLQKPNSNHISQVCRGMRKSAYGYFWEYA